MITSTHRNKQRLRPLASPLAGIEIFRSYSITPDIYRLTHDGYDRLNNYGEVVSSKKGLTTNATKIQKKPTDIKFKAKPEVSINNNGVADLNQATKAYTQILLD